MSARFLLSFAVLVAPQWNLQADERSDVAAKQKAVALANLKKLEIDMPGVHETSDLIVCGSLTGDRARTLGEHLQKQHAAVVKFLSFENGELPWTGKLTIYVFTDKKGYASFARNVEQRRPEPGEAASSDVRSDEPHVAIAAEQAPAAAIDAEAGKQVAVALLSRRASPAELPDWFRASFARAVQMRLEPKSAANDRTIIRKLLLRKINPIKASDGWMDSDLKEKSLIAASVVDYLVFGPESGAFPKLLAGFRASEGAATPTIDDALKSAEISPESLDKGWRKWVLTGK
jgi:hypothetical protein